MPRKDKGLSRCQFTNHYKAYPFLFEHKYTFRWRWGCWHFHGKLKKNNLFPFMTRLMWPREKDEWAPFIRVLGLKHGWGWILPKDSTVCALCVPWGSSQFPGLQQWGWGFKPCPTSSSRGHSSWSEPPWVCDGPSTVPPSALDSLLSQGQTRAG